MLAEIGRFFSGAVSALHRFLQLQIPLGGGSGVGAANLLGALGALALAYAASRLARRALRGGLPKSARPEDNRQFLLQRGVHWTIMGLGALAGLNILQLSLTNLLVVLGGLSVGIGFGLQGAASNLISGIILILERPFKIGDLVEVELPNGSVFGRIVHIGMRATVVAALDAKELIVPNNKMISETIHNLTHADRYFRLQIQVGVSYDSDIQLVKQTLLDAAAEHPSVLQETPPDASSSVGAPIVRFTQFGDSALQFELLAWIADSFQRFDIASDLHFLTAAKFRERGIHIPFPQRDVHVYPTTGAGEPPERV